MRDFELGGSYTIQQFLQESKGAKPTTAQATYENRNDAQYSQHIEGHLPKGCRILQRADGASKSGGRAGVAIEASAGDSLQQGEIDIEEVCVKYNGCAQLYLPSSGLLKEVYNPLHVISACLEKSMGLSSNDPSGQQPAM